MTADRTSAIPDESSRSRLGSNDDGSATLQFVVLAPVLIFATFLLLQAAMYYLANTSVTNGAQIALEAARAETATAQDGENAASGYLAQQSIVTDTSVSVDRTGEQVTVTTTGQAPSVVPFVQLPAVRSQLTGPVERVTAP